MKKIGLLISQFNKGGAERVVSRLTYILSEEYEVFLILFEDTNLGYDFKGELINLDIRSKPGLFNKLFLVSNRVKSLRKIKEEFDLDVVISFLDSPNIVNILSKTKKCKVVVSIRNYSTFEYTNLFKKMMIRFVIMNLYKKADKIIPVTKVIEDLYIKEFNIDKSKMHVIYNPYDVEQIQILSNEKIEEHYNHLFTGEITFISVGRQMYQKGYWHLVKAFSSVNAEYPNSKLVIVGKDFQSGKLQKLVNELELSSDVHLIGQQENPFKFMKRSDIFVLSSLFEGFPNAMVEAMICECPIIATDCKSGPREILLENPNLYSSLSDVLTADFGILVPPLELEENWGKSELSSGEKKLAKAMKLMIENKNLRENYISMSSIRSYHYSYSRCRLSYKKIIEDN